MLQAACHRQSFPLLLLLLLLLLAPQHAATAADTCSLTLNRAAGMQRNGRGA